MGPEPTAVEIQLLQELMDQDVSRETLDRLKKFSTLLVTWQKAINLISRSTIPHLWTRHILDSVQLHPLVRQRPGPVLDVGSGAGFPGLILALLGIDDVYLVESDSRKCAFLAEAARQTRTSVTLLNQRIETIPKIGESPIAVITARACASVTQMLTWTQHHAVFSTRYVLLKGKQAQEELTEAGKFWTMDGVLHPSVTDPTGRIVVLSSVTPAKPTVA